MIRRINCTLLPKVLKIAGRENDSPHKVYRATKGTQDHRMIRRLNCTVLPKVLKIAGRATKGTQDHARATKGTRGHRACL